MALPETPVAPTFPADLAFRLASMAYGRPFRRHQGLALDAFERARAAGRRRTYVCMPPGSGKTVLGLEMARRLGRPTLVLGPNTAIQAQWLAQWRDFQPSNVAASPDSDLATPFTVLTYQALCVLDRETEEGTAPNDTDSTDEVTPTDDGPDAAAAAADDAAAVADEAASAPAERARRRRLIARGGTREQVLGLLHPNGRAIVDAIAGGGGWTIVLDECHHLLELWGHLIEAVLAEIGTDAFVVGLTATPPGELEGRSAALYDRLFGQADFEVVTPAVVKEGDLAPYQELAYLTTPLPNEKDYVDAEARRFDDLVTDILDPSFASSPFLVWLDERVVQRRSASGAQVGWPHLEAEEPELAQSAMRLLWSRHLTLPRDAHLREQHRRPPTADDWMTLLDAFVRERLDGSADPHDRGARERIRAALPPVGYHLTREGIRRSVSVVDRVLSLSASKGAAAIEILDAEKEVLGDSLRALLLCDYEVAGREVGARLTGVLDPQAGSAALLIRTLLSSSVTRDLDPILLTGRTVACSRSTAIVFVRWAAEADPDLAGALTAADPLADAADRGAVWEDLVLIQPADSRWTPRRYVPLVTRFFEAGHARCLVGTRGLLGEGWDAHSVNVLIDLTAAATSTSVHQMRGRSLRLDPGLPHKVADNWDVVCVSADHVKGDADYSRFVRKHRAYFALTAQGEIESGVSHVDPTLSPYGPPPEPRFVDLDRRMLERVRQREGAWTAWGIGQPYTNTQAETVRVHAGRSMGLPGVRLLRRLPPDRRPARAVWVALESLGFGGLLMVAGIALGVWPVGVVAGLAVAALGALWSLRTVRAGLARLQPSDTLEDLACALAEALVATGLVAKGMGPDRVRIVPQPDGYMRCLLEGASAVDAETFANALDELLAPLGEPRWIIPRRVLQAVPSTLGALAYLVRRGTRQGLVVHHAVPSVLAARKDRVAAFERAWDRWVSPGAHALPEKDPRAQAVLELHRGDDPFAIETQMRTLWY